MKILSQRDIRWANIKIGKSTSTIGNYGCTLTAISMLAGTTPDVLNSKMTAVNGFQNDLIIWTALNKLGLNISYDNGRFNYYDNQKVLEAIDKNGGCLVEVDFDSRTATPSDRHWILFVGNGKAYDPWTGTEIDTTFYPLLKGYCVINVIKNDIIQPEEQPMTDEQKRILDFIGTRTEGDVREAFGALQDIPKLKEEMERLSLLLANLETRIDDLTEKLEEKEASIELCQKELKTANKQLDNKIKENEELTASLEAMTGERNQYKKWYENKCSELKDLDKMTAIQHILFGLKLLIKK